MIEASRKAAEVAAFALLGGPSVAKQLQEALERIRTAFRFVPDVVDVVEEARKRKEELDRLPARVRDLLQVLGEHGWYPDYIMPFPDIFDLAEALEQGDAEGAHERLCQHFEERMDEILEDLTASFPQRAGILRLAFGAHRRGEYALSIPALLAQTDGICKELVGVQLYGRQKSGRLRLAKTVESWRKSDLGKAMLLPKDEITIPPRETGNKRCA